MKRKNRLSVEIENVELIGIGEEKQELKYVQDFLLRFGYLKDGFYKISVLDNNTSIALKKYQKFNNLELTGYFNEETRSLMKLPRCGVPDFKNEVSFSTMCKWDKLNLHYAIGNVTSDVSRESAVQAIKNAFNSWENVSPFTFTEVSLNENLDILIEWTETVSGDHNMRGGVVAHSDFPLGCSVMSNSLPLPIHFDTEHSWCIGAFVDQFDIESIAVHEIGHILGLAHSNVHGSIMYSNVSSNYIKRTLTQDDILGIQSLYGS
ncbi:hypothetical protein COK25_10195 [Bacillus cereus]|uniref:matrixin family metalloprotease n=1 Tax=Bacillus cereus TaxID=1396 RepID=UPI000BF5AE2E|nr:matrixin family metalloprotease [Bacillus cereus]PEZ84858.1 hypothetical protein CN376_29305 [Bacillus cereus]PFE99094.1 hypothetical protein CN323_17180 [Bacillus cereus]PFQ56058.1 hypothetical protein COK25_10195 [Bacillus cereus]PGK87519.1 hypothetical protein CN910_28770 [Bacillus cereus]